MKNGKIKVVVMIPAFNEERTIGHVIRAIPRDCADEVEVIVINDGSKDKTKEVALKAGANEVISHKANYGLGVTFKDGINAALKRGADIIVNIDADGQFNPNDIPKLLQPIIENKADMVTCSRFKDPKLIPKMPKIKIFGNRLFAKLLNLFLNRNYYDTQCGFRTYSKEAAMNLTLFSKFTYTQEVFIDLVKKRFRIIEIPCKVIGERKGKSRVVSNVLSYGFKVSLIILRSTRDYEPLKFFGVPGATMFSLGFFGGITLFIRYLFLTKVDPYLSIFYISIFLMIIGVLFIILGLLADMLDRNRQLQEEIIYRMKKEELKKK